VQFIHFKTKKKIYLFIALQFFSSLLDLAAIASMGLLTIAAATFNAMSSENGLVSQFLLYLRDHVNGERALFLLLSITSVGLFLLKSDVSIYYSRKVLRFLSERVVEISSQLLYKFSKQSLIFTQKESNQEVVSSLYTGISSSVLGILGSASIMIGEFGLFFILATGLLFVDPVLTFVSLIYFLLSYLHFNTFYLGLQYNLGEQGLKQTFKQLS
jgi:hypothetical protein